MFLQRSGTQWVFGQSEEFTQPLLTKFEHIYENEDNNITQAFEKVRRLCKKSFPIFTDLGHELRVTRFISSINAYIFICGINTIGKIESIKKQPLTKTIPRVNLTNFAVCSKKDTLFLVGKKNSSSKSEKSVLVEVKMSNLSIEQNWYSNEGISQIFYCKDEDRLYVLTKKGVFWVKFIENKSEIVLVEVFEEEFSCFKYSKNEWLLGKVDGEIRRTDKNGNMLATNKVASSVKMLKYSNKGELIVALFDKNVTLLTLKLEIFKNITLKYQLTAVKMDNTKQNLFLSTDTGFFIFFSLSTEQAFYIPVHRDEIVYFYVDKQQKKILTFSKDSKMAKFRFPTIIEPKTEGFHALNFVFCGPHPNIVFIESKTIISRWNIHYEKKELIHESTSELNKCLDYFSPKNLLLFSETEKIILMDLPSKVIKHIISIAASTILSHSKFNDTGSHFFTLAEQNTSVYCFSIDDVKKDPLKCKFHYARVNSQANIKDEHLTVTGGNGYKLIIWDYISGKKQKTLKGHTGAITSIQTITEGNRIISGSKDTTIKVWDWKTGQLIITLDSHKSAIVKVRVDDSNQLISVSAEGTMIYWNLNAYVKIFKYNFNCSISDFSLSADYQWAAYVDLDVLKVINFPTHIVKPNFMKYPNRLAKVLKSSQSIISKRSTSSDESDDCEEIDDFDVIGPKSEDKYQYIYYIYKILKGDPVRYNPDWDDWAVMPFQFNTLLFYSYMNLYKNLKRSIQSGSFLIPNQLADPYSISTTQKHERCLKVLFESTKKMLDSNSHSHSFITPQVITHLNKAGHPNLHIFYQNIFRKSENDYFPKFIDKDLIPAVYFSENLHPNYELFFGKKIQNENFDVSERFGKRNNDSFTLTIKRRKSTLSVPALLYTSSIKYDFTNGSKSSIEFLTSIIQCGNTEIFKTKYIQTILDKKWKDLRPYQLIQAFFYTFYMVSLTLYLATSYGTTWAYISLISVVGLLACFDALQMLTNFSLFWKDFWNYLDLARLALFTLFSYFFFYQVHTDWFKEIMASICFVSFARGIAFFRVFDNTRYLIRLILCVIQDGMAFVIILTYSTFCFSIIRMVEDDQEKHFFEYLRDSIMVNLGEIGDGSKSLIGWSIFATMGFINIILLLNLLISIMSDTFTKVKEDSEVANYIEIAQMVREIETIHVFKDNVKKDTYLQLCEEDTSEEIDLEEGTKKTQKYLKMLVKHIIRKD